MAASDARVAMPPSYHLPWSMGDAPNDLRRGALLVGAVGLGVGIAVAGLVYSVLAVPLYVFAQIDPDGLDRPMIRTAFFNVAVPAGLVAGVVAGVLVGRLVRPGRAPARTTRGPDDPADSVPSSCTTTSRSAC